MSRCEVIKRSANDVILETLNPVLLDEKTEGNKLNLGGGNN